MNVYADMGSLRRALNVHTMPCDAASTQDLVLTAAAASRHVEQYCQRVFWTIREQRAFDGGCDEAYSPFWDGLGWGVTMRRSSSGAMRIPDLLSAHGVATEHSDGDETEWASGDYRLAPYNRLPKWEFRRHPRGGRFYPASTERLLLSGVWGYGDGVRPHPWRATGVNLTLSEDDDGVIASGLQAGWTLLIDEEQVFVEAVIGDDVTLIRGVNGTTPASHTAAAASRALYPADIVRVTELVAADFWNTRDKIGLGGEQLPGYMYQMGGSEMIASQKFARILDPYRRWDYV